MLKFSARSNNDEDANYLATIITETFKNQRLDAKLKRAVSVDQQFFRARPG
jgi:hypothetical protein